ncbi:MAG: sulfite reductase [Simkania sp.]|nr:sulfite reductase [Simkania sp.]
MTEYNKNNPFPAKLLERTLLNREGSSKQTYHLKLDFSLSQICYEPGDAIGIFPENPPAIVDSILEALKKTGKEEVVDPRSQATFSLKHFLCAKSNLIRITLPMLKQFPALHELTEDKEARKEFLEHHDLEDLLTQQPNPNISLQELVSYISPMLPRFYSIASSQRETPDSVDLLVVTFQYKQGGKMRWGLGSHFLCDQARIGETVIPSYHHPNAMFKVPKDKNTSLIMIGPGTGVAPYRAFLQERLRQKASGKNWLFFGERMRAYDFYYEDFFTELEEAGFLRLDCAFSRDQEEKVYVQHLIQKHATDIWAWIQDGSHIYICGDARHMAKDVTATLHDIVAEKGKLSDEEAKDFIRKMRQEKRLLLDVY